MSIVFEPYAAVVTNTTTARLRRARRVRLSDQASVFLLHREPQMTMTGTVTRTAIMELRHRSPRVRMADADNVFLLHREPHVALSGGVPIPTATVFALNSPPPIVHMEATVTHNITMQLHREPRVLLAEAGGRFLLRPRHQVYLYDGTSLMNRTAFMLQQPYLTASVVQGQPVNVQNGLLLGSLTEGVHVSVRMARLGMLEQSNAFLDALLARQEGLRFGDMVTIVLPVLIAEAMKLGDTPTAWREVLVHAMDALALLAGPDTLLDARQVVAETLALNDEAARAWPEQVLETLALAETAVHGLDGWQRVLDTVRMQDTPVGRATFTALVDDTLALGDAPTSTAELVARIREGVEFLATVHLPSGQYLAWVLHGDTRGYTQYSHFPFNSFCELDGRYFGATDTGIYELTGDDDAGEPIEARVRGGLTDMGTGKLKRMESLYLGYRADGDMVLKVVTTSADGAKREDWYALQPRPADAVREGRIKIGRGLKSRYWGFELANVNGADFALDSMEWLPMTLERRI